MVELNGKPFGDMFQTYGGDTLNAATYLRRSAANHTQISYVTAIGTDPLSRGMCERWQQEGIDTSLVMKDSGRTIGAYLIQLDDDGERTFMYWRANSPASQLLKQPGFDHAAKRINDEYDTVFLSGISMAILDEKDRKAMLVHLDQWRQAGITLVFDSNYRPALWNNDLSSVRELYAKVYQCTQMALVTFDDEAAIWGDLSPQQTIQRLTQQHGVGQVIVKLGADGCLVGNDSGNKPQHIPTNKVETVVDTTSAGNAFNGGFLSGYLAGKTIEECCQRGNALAGTVIQHKGAIIDEQHIRIEKV